MDLKTFVAAKQNASDVCELGCYCNDLGYLRCHICTEYESFERWWDGAKWWAWNASIFEVYDELKHEGKHTQREALSVALAFFSNEDSKKQIRELAYHFDVELEDVNV